MDNWSIKYSHDESPAGNKLISIYIKLIFDGVEMADIVDIDGWYEAVLSEGKKPLFTCGCGNFGCGGYFMEVSHSAQGVRLKNKYHPLDENDLIEALDFEISWEDIFLIYTEIVDYLVEIRDRYPEYELCIGTYSDNLVIKIEKYQRIYEYLRRNYDE